MGEREERSKEQGVVTMSPLRGGREGYVTGAKKKLLGHHLAGTLWEEESF